MGNCCGVTPTLEDDRDPTGRVGIDSLEASFQSNAQHNYMGETSGYVSSHMSGHLTPDSLTEPVATEPQQLEHIADREGEC